MNRKSLNQIFTAYIDKFRFLNEDPQCEGYKWYSVVQFKEAFDLDAPDFAAMLKRAKQVTYNIIDSYNQPFGGLVKIAEQSAEDAEAVRELFRALLKDDGGDLTIRQEKITEFLKGCDALVEKYYPGSFLYKNDQRSAMAYLFFNDPDNHYLYKATEANYLSDCVGFYDDWGAMSAFKLDIYHRFCDELIAEIKATPELLKTNESRYENTTKKLHADPNLHILLFDIIYCSHTYNLYSGLSFDKVTTAERKLYQENKAKAQELLAAVQKAESDLVQLQEAQRYFSGLIDSKVPVSHKAFGENIAGFGDVCAGGRKAAQQFAGKVIGVRMGDEGVAHTGKIQAQLQLGSIQVGVHVNQQIVIHDRAGTQAQFLAAAAECFTADVAIAEKRRNAFGGSGAQILKFHMDTSFLKANG